VTIEQELTLLRLENQALRAENQALKEQLGQAVTQLAAAWQRHEELEQRITELERRSGGPPSFAKPNRPKPAEPREPRKKRAREHNHARRREDPTRKVQHALERCPECHYQLRGTSLDYVRQVVELPEPRPVEVTEHEVIKRYCPKCEKWRSPKLDLSGQVLGQGRMGVRLISLIAYLRHTVRLPVRRIQVYLQSVHQLSISSGEIIELMHQVRQATRDTVEALKQQVRASRIVHADETGWREGGRNGYIWGFFTLAQDGSEGPVRYYEYDPSRGQGVVRRILGQKTEGHLVTDFYVGYNDYAGSQQRCWVHFLRDLRQLKDDHAPEAEVVEWAEAVRALYDRAQEWIKGVLSPSGPEREKEYVSLVGQALDLGAKYAQNKGHPCRALAKRIYRHQDELFQFVLVEGLSADNNLAERSIRPLVVIRKISGGSRSAQGSKTRMALATLFETWQARGQNPFLECLRLLSRSPAPAS
jgi:transposase